MSPSFNTGPIVVVGAGQAGGRAAEALRASGFTGAITLIGEESHLPYERPQLSKDMLLNPEAELALIRSHAQWAELDVQVHLGAPVVAADAERRLVALADGREFTYGRLLLATGTRPRRLPTLDSGPTPVLLLRDVHDAQRLRHHLQPGRRLVLVGGGVVGLEVAAAAATRGCRVTVVEAAAQLLPQVGSPRLSTCLTALHTAHGVELRCGSTVEANVPGGVLLTDGSRIEADCLLLGIGVTPEVSLAASLGLQAEHGIRVHADGHTDLEHVFAAGDLAQQFSRWHGRWMRIENYANAQNQSAAVAQAMLGGAYAAQAAPWFWTDQHGANVQVVGNPAAGEELVRGPADGKRLTLGSFRDGELVGAITVNNPRDMAALRRLVSAGTPIQRSDFENPATDLRRLSSPG